MFASAGKSLHIYSLERGGLKSISKYCPKPNVIIKHISWCHDNSYIALIQENEFVQIISTKDPSKISLIHTISSMPDVTALKFKSNTKRVLALGTKKGEVMLYDTKNRCVTKILGQLDSEITSLEFSSLDDLAVISDKSLIIFDINDLDKVEMENPERCSVLKCLNRNSDIVVVGCVNGIIILWNIIERSQAKTYHLHTAEISGIAISNTDKVMVTSGMDNKICVIDNSSKECIFKKVLHQPVTSIDISANEEHMVAGLKDGSIYVYQMADHLKPQIYSRMHVFSINKIAFVNGLSLEQLESVSIMEEENESEVNNSTNQEKDSTPDLIAGPVPIEKINQCSQEELSSRIPEIEEDIEVSEEKVKLDLIKVVNSHFSHLEEQLSDHCGKLQVLVSNELDSLYAVAARWECFKTMQVDEIVRYICGIVTASSETKILSQKSEHSNSVKEL